MAKTKNPGGLTSRVFHRKELTRIVSLDFPESNLSYTRLSGADLSGALLSNANLRGANLHRASLALANLSGADLREADLRGANLSQVNLSSAKVQGLRWGENEGIAPAVEAYLQAAGAILG